MGGHEETDAMTPPDELPPHAWLEELAWVRRLAARLVRDPAAAEDVAQDALVVAWSRPPDRGVPLRSWLAGVVRRVASARRRGEARREAREHAAARAEAVDAEHALERLELHERLVAAVRGLDEPYRSTLLLRFFDELDVATIARRHGVPPKTVHARIERALERLRVRLDGQYGDRGSWAAWCPPTSALPFAPSAPHVAPTSPHLFFPTSVAKVADAASSSVLHVTSTSAARASAGVGPGASTSIATPTGVALLLAMSTVTKWVAGTAAAVVLALVAWRVSAREDGARVEPAAVALEARAAKTPDSPDTPRSSPSDRRAAVPSADTSAPDVAAATTAVIAPGDALVRGIVVDASFRPVAGLEVGWVPLGPDSRVSRPLASPAPVTSAEDGTFAIEPVPSEQQLVASGREFATIYSPIVHRGGPRESVRIVVGPARSYAGRTLDETGAPVAYAEVRVWPGDDLARRLDLGSFESAWQLAHATSDVEGRFTLPILGYLPEARLHANAEHHETGALVLPAASDEHLVLTLKRSERAVAPIAGRVEFEDGRPAARAYVSAGDRSERADVNGRFTWTPTARETPTSITAVLAGHAPGTVSLVGLGASEKQDLRLVLGAAARTLGGRVLDARGAPVARAHVWTTDGTPFAPVLTRIGDVSVLLRYDLEGVVDGVEDGLADGRRRRADAEGRFELTGLLDRTYAVFVQHPETFEIAGPFACASGRADLVCVLPGAEPTRRVAGVVTTAAGKPITGAVVRVARMPPESAGARVGGGLVEAASASDPHTTGADGRFEFPALCTSGTRLVVSLADGGTEALVTLDGSRDLEDLRVVLALRGSFRVRFTEPVTDGDLSVEDASGEVLDLEVDSNGVTLRMPGMLVSGDSTDRITVPETARTIVLQIPGRPEERFPVRIVPGEFVEIRH